MNNLTETKEKLNKLYKEYKNNKYRLSSAKSKETADLLFALTFNNEAVVSDIAEQLSRFSADVVKAYFDVLTKNGNIQVSLLDEIIKAFQLTDKDPAKSQYYVQKFVFTVSVIMKNYKEKAVDSTQLPRLVVFASRYAVKADKHKTMFQKLINETAGGIYMLDYSGIKRNVLLNMWNATDSIFPDLSKSRYESLISEWRKKYGFLKETSVKAKEITADDNRKASAENSSAKVDIPENTESADSTDVFIETLADRLCNALKKEQEAVITALNESFAPVKKAVSSIQNDVSRSYDIINKLAETERRQSEQNMRILEAEQKIRLLEDENNELKNQITALENENTELDSKLDEAYSINSRESSLEAEKVRSDLKKSFS
ncbi:MAG: hypothetical protein NC548_48330, partial [Lachnospiraceae bacterium]|nr:hypothetical protein [Lachnospiraceae bacterium]